MMRRPSRLSLFGLALAAWLLPAAARAGDPTFVVGSTFDASTSSTYVQSQDLNHDGATDVVVCDRYASTVSIWFGSGSGDLTLGSSYPVVGGPYSAVIYNANGDSHPDIATCIAYPGAFQLLLNDGQGGFTVLPAQAGIANLSSIANGDFGGGRDPGSARLRRRHWRVGRTDPPRDLRRLRVVTPPSSARA